MDAERYSKTYTEVSTGAASWVQDGIERVCSLWQKLMNAYILPCGPRELNLPSPVRDRLLSLPSATTPPHPSELDDAVHIVYELMNDSVLVPFLQSAAPSQEQQQQQQQPESRDPQETKQRRSILRSADDSNNRSPKAHFLPMFGLSRSGEQSSPSSADPLEVGLSDDSGSVGSPRNEPVTPPTTPPTPEWTTSGPLQRAISAHNTGWKKVGQKLGINRKSRSKRQTTTSIPSTIPDADSSLGSRTSGVRHSSGYPL